MNPIQVFQASLKALNALQREAGDAGEAGDKGPEETRPIAREMRPRGQGESRRSAGSMNVSVKSSQR